ncbi:hypothetical protein IFM89_038568 [Coptis chinensis]|uniref:CCHC-type domain-containing protein n=1 Tax=Coptis chinensis TaxID=261450 RepID=A0A835HHE2_9MAGN|nr:hypothetical protein IFM89_038568 [Coptis chinensis]
MGCRYMGAIDDTTLVVTSLRIRLVGHMIRDCMGGLMICHNCGGCGHMAYDCLSGRLMECAGRRSYELMEQTLKVYTYREGARPVFHQSETKFFGTDTVEPDHFLVACHDWALHEMVRHMIRCIRALCNADVNEGFVIGNAREIYSEDLLYYIGKFKFLDLIKMGDRLHQVLQSCLAAANHLDVFVAFDTGVGTDDFVISF